jgi:ABC-type multidrug transport system fused ATPase/permease subunit
MSYRADSPVILDQLDLRLPLGTKTALVGRTGSGKTSVVQALFRMVHVRGGDLRIGPHSALERELGSVRRLFGVVPQQPYLFAGTLRENLDRTGRLGDARLREALGAVGLPLPLDLPVDEGGQNLSVGERQLLCLARIIAADRPFVIMDEATSGLDPETDARIHRVLRTRLTGKTVLTIAHRRESLFSYDRIVEMARGRVIWSGTPGELLARERAGAGPVEIG